MSRNTLRVYLLFSLLLAACVSSCAYPISPKYRREATPDLTFAMVYNDPESHKGDIVIWGGRVIRTVNTAKGSQIYVLETPLSFREKPKPAEYSEGRFIAETPSYIDPLVYHSGKMVTIAGVVTGSRKVTGQKNKLTYVYPVIQIKELNLWKKQRVYTPYPYYPYYDEWGYGPYWGYGGFYGFEGEGVEGEGEHEGGEGFESGGEERFEGGGGGERGERGGGRK